MALGGTALTSGGATGRKRHSSETSGKIMRKVSLTTRQKVEIPCALLRCSVTIRRANLATIGLHSFNSLLLTCMRLVYSLDYGMAIATTSSSSEAACGNTCFSYSAHVPAHQLFISGAVRGRAKHLLFFRAFFISSSQLSRSTLLTNRGLSFRARAGVIAHLPSEPLIP